MQIIIFVVSLIIGVSGNRQFGFSQSNMSGNIAGKNNIVNNTNLNGNPNNGGRFFVMPWLSLLAGGGNNGGDGNGNIFGETVTVTKTLVSTGN